MDPNNNSTSNPNPVPGAVPNPGQNPASGQATPLNPVQTGPSVPQEPSIPMQPTTPPAPAEPMAPPVSSEPVVPSMPSRPVAPAQPVNPIIAPSSAPGVMPASPTFQANGMADSDPIMMPEPAKKPDPVEEELNAPMKAAAPTPGSIGSAISGPAGEMLEGANNPFAANDKQTPNVAFNDPAMQPEGMAAAGATKVKKKISSRTTLLILIAVAAMVVVALAAVLIVQLMNNNSDIDQTTPNGPTTIEVDATDDSSSSPSSAPVSTNTITCTKAMTEAELLEFTGAVSGTFSVSANFDSDNMLTDIALTKSVVYSGDDITGSEPVDVESYEATAGDLTLSTAATYNLPTDETGSLDLLLGSIRANYESLDYTCEAL